MFDKCLSSLHNRKHQRLRRHFHQSLRFHVQSESAEETLSLLFRLARLLPIRHYLQLLPMRWSNHLRQPLRKQRRHRNLRKLLRKHRRMYYFRLYLRLYTIFRKSFRREKSAQNQRRILPV